jgi:serine/threonine protein kinase
MNLFTGKLPFESTDAMELVHCHIAKTPIPVCEVNPKVPPILSDIIMKLMEKMPKIVIKVRGVSKPI